MSATEIAACPSRQRTRATRRAWLPITSPHRDGYRQQPDTLCLKCIVCIPFSPSSAGNADHYDPPIRKADRTARNAFSMAAVAVSTAETMGFC